MLPGKDTVGVYQCAMQEGGNSYLKFYILEGLVLKETPLSVVLFLRNKNCVLLLYFTSFDKYKDNSKY